MDKSCFATCATPFGTHTYIHHNIRYI